VQEFSNVYYYDGLAGRPSTSEADTLIDQVASREKANHASDVTFVRGRLWEQTGDKATTEMLSQKNLSGTGAMTVQSGLDKERAWLFRLRAGVDSRGNPVYLRKWFHFHAAFASASVSNPIMENNSGFTAAQRTFLEGLINNIGSIGSGTTLGSLCAKHGRQPTAGAQWSAHAFLEHHQFGDQWRAQ